MQVVLEGPEIDVVERVLNVCFHGIGRASRPLEPGEDAYWIQVDTYHRILDRVATRHDVRLSFDDGNVSDIEVGLPGLLERGLTATFFPLAGRLERSGSLSCNDVCELDRQGMRIGTHGVDHVPWRGLSQPALRRELTLGRSALEEVIGKPVTEAALPLGRYDRRVLSQLRRLGYARVFSSDRLETDSSAWLQPRFSVRVHDTAQGFVEEVLGRPGLVRRARARAVGMAKRWR